MAPFSWIHTYILPPRLILWPWTPLAVVFPDLLAIVIFALSESFSSGQTQLVLVLLHGLGFVGLAFGLWQASRGAISARARAAPLLSLSYLQPIPFAVAIGVGIIAVAYIHQRQQVLAYQVFKDVMPRWMRAFDTGSPAPQWTALKLKLRSSWEEQPWWRRLVDRRVKFDSTPSMTKSAKKIFLLAHLKALLLLPEGAVFSHGVLWVQDARPHSWFLDLVPLISGGSFIVGSAAAMVAGFTFLKRCLTLTPHHRLPFAPYLAASHLSFFVGIIVGAYLVLDIEMGIDSASQGEDPTSCIILIFYGGIWAVLFTVRSTLFFVFRVPPHYQGQESRVWIFGCIVPLAAGLLPLKAELAEDGLELLRSLVFLLVAVGFVTSVMLYRWVLRPRRLQDLFDRGLPLRARVEIAFLAVTALVPLGGLAAPAWFYLRRKFLESSE